MIVVVSNRKVDPSETDEKFFGEKLSTGGGVQTCMALAGYELDETHDDTDEDVLDGGIDPHLQVQTPRYKWTLSPVDLGQEPATFTEILNAINAGELSKRWLLFVHGNNQTTRKNLEKCRKLAEMHDVNVVAFSWPSWGELFSPELGIKIAAKLLIGGFNWGFVASTLGGGVAKKKAHYKKAVENAVKSRKALHATIRTLNEHLIQPARAAHQDEFKMSMLVHSLGNHVVENMIIDDDLVNHQAVFDNVIFHQADVDAAGHNVWTDTLALGERHYITHNEKDWVLRVSDFFGDNPRRLGNGLEGPSSENVHAYIDFTDGKNIRAMHGIFLTKEKKNDRVNDCFNALLSGEPLFVNGSPANGFEKIEGNRFAIKKDLQLTADYSDDFLDS